MNRFLLATAAAIIAGPVAAALAERAVALDIPAQPMAQALNELARQSGLQILFPYADAVGTAPAIKGSYPPREVLRRLIARSALVIVADTGNSISLARRPQSSSGKTLAAASVAAAPGMTDTAAPSDDIIVTGARAGLATSLKRKRDADGVTDVVAADDIARFPAENVAEALQRIPGVAISRDQGEGTTASVRGLPPSLVLVQVNGATAVTGLTGREFSFDIFSADLFSSVEVLKSSAADRDEGGVAATINLNTPNPLDLPTSTIRLNAQGSYVELADKFDARGSALFSHKSDDDRFGVMLGIAYSDRSLRQDNSSGNGWSQLSFDLNGDKVNDVEDVYVARTLRTQLFLEDRRRIGATGKIQFRPSDAAEISFDATYTNFKVDRFRTNHSFAFADGATATSITEEDGTAVKATFNNVRNRTTVRTETIRNDLLSLGLKGHVDTGSWTLSGAATYGRAEARMPNGAVVRYEARGTIGYDITGDYRFPEITGAPDPRTGAGMTYNQLAFDSYLNRDEEIAGQADAERHFDDSWLSSLKFGVKLRDRKKHREATADTTTVGRGAPLSDILVPFPVDDFFAGQGGPNFRRWVALPDIDQVRSRFYPAVVPATLDPLDSFDVEELSYAGYARADFRFDLFGGEVIGDAGVRVVRTEQTSAGFVDEDGTVSPTSIKRSYTNALPSLNLRFDPTDRLRIRMGLARVMTRPALNDISPRREIFSGQQRVEEGNVFLDPFVANQADLSVEFYPSRETLLSAAFFYKDIKSFTATREAIEQFRGEDYLFSRIVNGDGGHVYGVELTYQQPFTFLPAPLDGFGTALTYTYARSQTRFPAAITTQKLPLEGLSRNSFNATLYYEKGPFGLRASYNYRDGYVLAALGAGGTPVFVDDYGQLDLSANLKLTSWLTLRAEALNILDERSYSYSGKINQITDYDRTGPKYFVGFSASF